MYGTLENNVMKPAPRAIRIGGAVICNSTDEQVEAVLAAAEGGA